MRSIIECCLDGLINQNQFSLLEYFQLYALSQVLAVTVKDHIKNALMTRFEQKQNEQCKSNVSEITNIVFNMTHDGVQKGPTHVVSIFTQ